MINQGLLDQNLFTFYLGNANDGEGASGGEAVFGGIDDTHYEGKITYAPIRRKGYWEVELEKVKFGDEVMELGMSEVSCFSLGIANLVIRRQHWSCYRHRYLFDRFAYRCCRDYQCRNWCYQVVSYHI